MHTPHSLVSTYLNPWKPKNLDGQVVSDKSLPCGAGYGDVAPTTRTERIVAMCIMAVGERAMPAIDLRRQDLRACQAVTSVDQACISAVCQRNAEHRWCFAGLLLFGLIIGAVGSLLEVCFQAHRMSTWRICMLCCSAPCSAAWRF